MRDFRFFGNRKCKLADALEMRYRLASLEDRNFTTTGINTESLLIRKLTIQFSNGHRRSHKIRIKHRTSSVSSTVE